MTVASKLYGFQRLAVDFAIDKQRVAMLCEQGVGKTWITLGVIERLAETPFEGLVVVPLANIETTWVRTILEHLPGVELHRTWESFKASRAHARLLLLHYEAMAGKQGKKLTRKLVKYSWDFICYDESQRLKARGSAQSRAAARFKYGDHRMILSGTPIDDSPADLWAQFRFANPDVFGTRWAEFDGEWLKPVGFMGYQREFLWKKLPKFLATIKPWVMRVTKEEVLDLPALTVTLERVPLLGDQRRAYEDIDRDMTHVLVDGRTIDCDITITQLVRLQQIVGGFVRTADGDSVVVGTAKKRRLRRLVRLSVEPLVIFCKYKEELEIVGEIMNETTRPWGFIRGVKGKLGKRRRVAIVEAFQRGEIDVLVCQIKAGGVGLDLFRAAEAIFYSCTFSHIDFWQGISRLHRHGQTRQVRVTCLTAQNTVDEVIWEALRRKHTITRQVLDPHRKVTKMAKKEEKAKPAPAAKKEEAAATVKAKPTPPPQPPKPKYGVPEMAEILGTKATSVRVRLRKAKIAKNGKLYGWDTKTEMMEAIEALKAASTRKPKTATAAESADEEEDEEDEE